LRGCSPIARSGGGAVGGDRHGGPSARANPPNAQAELAAYYQRGLTPESWDIATAEPRRDMDPALAKRLGLDPNRTPRWTRSPPCSAPPGGWKPHSRKQLQRATRSLADELNLDPLQALQPEQIEHILGGRRADGEALPEGRGLILRRRFLGSLALAPTGR